MNRAESENHKPKFKQEKNAGIFLVFQHSKIIKSVNKEKKVEFLKIFIYILKEHEFFCFHVVVESQYEKKD